MCMKLVTGHLIPAKFQTPVPSPETNSIHTTQQIHIVLPLKYFVAFITAFPQKQALPLMTGKQVIVSLKSKLFFQAFLVELHNVSLFSPSVFHTVLVRMFTVDRKVSTVFTIALRYCYIILDTGDFKGIYHCTGYRLHTACIPKVHGYLGNWSKQLP